MVKKRVLKPPFPEKCCFNRINYVEQSIKIIFNAVGECSILASYTLSHLLEAYHEIKSMIKTWNGS